MPAVTTNHHIKKLQAMAAEGALLLGAANAMSWDIRRIQYWEKRLDIKFQRTRSTRAALPEGTAEKFRACADSGMTLDETKLLMGWGREKTEFWERKLGLRFRRLRRMKKNDATHSS